MSVLDRLEGEFLDAMARPNREGAYAAWGAYMTAKLFMKGVDRAMDATAGALARCEYCGADEVVVKLTFEGGGVSYVCPDCAEREHAYVLEEAGE